VIDVYTPYEAQEFKTNSYASAYFSCTDEKLGSGLKSWTGTVDNGGVIDTSSTGTKQFTVSAEDCAGDKDSKTVTYYVISLIKKAPGR
jgi:hypothetical protein